MTPTAMGVSTSFRHSDTNHAMGWTPVRLHLALSRLCVAGYTDPPNIASASRAWQFDMRERGNTPTEDLRALLALSELSNVGPDASSLAAEAARSRLIHLRRTGHHSQRRRNVVCVCGLRQPDVRVACRPNQEVGEEGGNSDRCSTGSCAPSG